MKNQNRESPESKIARMEPALYTDRFTVESEPGMVRVAFLEGIGENAKLRARLVMSVANAASLIEALRQAITTTNELAASTIQ